MNILQRKLPYLLTLTVCACVPEVMTPTVAVMPGPGKPLELFAADQSACRQFAEQQIAAARQQLNNQVAGAALFTHSDDPVASGQAVAQAGIPQLQQQYDVAYSQCMYAKGNQVPGYMASPEPPPRRHIVRRRARHPVSQGQAAAEPKFVEPAPAAGSAASPATFVEPPAAKQ